MKVTGITLPAASKICDIFTFSPKRHFINYRNKKVGFPDGKFSPILSQRGTMGFENFEVSAGMVRRRRLRELHASHNPRWRIVTIFKPHGSERPYIIFTSISTPAGRLRLVSELIVPGVGLRISINRLCTLISNCSRVFL